MADHLLQQTRPQNQVVTADYYIASLPTTSFDITLAEPRRDMNPRLADLLGIDLDRATDRDEIAGLLSGCRVDGAPIRGKQVQQGTECLAMILGLDATRVPNAVELENIVSGRRADGGKLDDDVAEYAFKRLFMLYGGSSGAGVASADLAQMRAGRRVDGTELNIASTLEGLLSTRTRVGYIDLTWSADKTVSLAWAFAPTDAERAIIAQAHYDAVTSALRQVESDIGRARKGKAGRDGFDPGSIAWIRFDHFTSRPTIEVLRQNPKSKEPHVELLEMPVAGDPQLHSHVAIPNVVLTDHGRVGGLDLRRLKGRIKVLGALYQAYLGTNLRLNGVDVELDPGNGAARLSAIPASVREAFSKRTSKGLEKARSYVASLGLDWERLSAERKIGFVKTGVQGDPNQVRQDAMADWIEWRVQAADLGWHPKSVLNLDRPIVVKSRAERLDVAYQAGCALLEIHLQTKAVLTAADARVCAARGLVAAGIESASDVNAVLRLFAERGVRNDGQDAELVWGITVGTPWHDTTRLNPTLHVEREAELVELARSAAGDRSAALTAAAIGAAAGRSNPGYPGEHGQSQMSCMERLGQGGRLSVAIEAPGSGRSMALAALVDAWIADGRTVYGATAAWRQPSDLTAAGIGRDRLADVAMFLNQAEKGAIELDRSSVVVVDELGKLGAKQLLALLRLQETQGFQLAAIGDPRECQLLEAGPVIDLLRRALGAGTVPKLLTTVRKATERERETSLLFRAGRAAEALDRKLQDGTAVAVPGGYRDAVEYVAELYLARHRANANTPFYTLTVSAPTTGDAREIAGTIRRKRQQAGHLSSDEEMVDAVDPDGVHFNLPISVGDRVRLFKRTNAAYADKSRGLIGSNGSVLEVRKIDADGVILRNPQGTEGRVKWDTLRDKQTGRILLTYGDVLLIDAAQGVSSTELIEAMPAGSRVVDSYTAYAAASPHRQATWIVTSDDAERQEVRSRRPVRDPHEISAADVWANVAVNLSRAPQRASALTCLEQALDVRQGATVALQRGLQRQEQRVVDGLPSTTLGVAQHRRHQQYQFATLIAALQCAADLQTNLRQALSNIRPAVDAMVGKELETARSLFAGIMKRRGTNLLLSKLATANLVGRQRRRLVGQQVTELIFKPLHVSIEDQQSLFKREPLDVSLLKTLGPKLGDVRTAIRSGAERHTFDTLLLRLDAAEFAHRLKVRRGVQQATLLKPDLQAFVVQQRQLFKGEALVASLRRAFDQPIDETAALIRVMTGQRRLDARFNRPNAVDFATTLRRQRVNEYIAQVMQSALALAAHQRRLFSEQRGAAPANPIRFRTLAVSQGVTAAVHGAVERGRIAKLIDILNGATFVRTLSQGQFGTRPAHAMSSVPVYTHLARQFRQRLTRQHMLITLSTLPPAIDAQKKLFQGEPLDVSLLKTLGPKLGDVRTAIRSGAERHTFDTLLLRLDAAEFAHRLRVRRGVQQATLLKPDLQAFVVQQRQLFKGEALVVSLRRAFDQPIDEMTALIRALTGQRRLDARLNRPNPVDFATTLRRQRVNEHMAQVMQSALALAAHQRRLFSEQRGAAPANPIRFMTLAVSQGVTAAVHGAVERGRIAKLIDILNGATFARTLPQGQFGTRPAHAMSSVPVNTHLARQFRRRLTRQDISITLSALPPAIDAQKRLFQGEPLGVSLLKALGAPLGEMGMRIRAAADRHRCDALLLHLESAGFAQRLQRRRGAQQSAVLVPLLKASADQQLGLFKHETLNVTRAFNQPIGDARDLVRAVAERRMFGALLGRLDADRFAITIRRRRVLEHSAQVAELSRALAVERRRLLTGQRGVAPADPIRFIAGIVARSVVPVMRADIERRRVETLIDRSRVTSFARTLRRGQLGRCLTEVISPLSQLLRGRDIDLKARAMAVTPAAQTAITDVMVHTLRIIREHALRRRKTRFVGRVIAEAIEISSHATVEPRAVWTLTPGRNEADASMPALYQIIGTFQRSGISIITLSLRSGQTQVLVPVKSIHRFLMDIGVKSMLQWEVLFREARAESDSRAEPTPPPSSVSKPDLVREAHALIDAMTTSFGMVHVVVPNFTESCARPDASRAQFRQAFIHLASRFEGTQTGCEALRPLASQPLKEETSPVSPKSLKESITPANAQLVITALTEMKPLLEAAREWISYTKHLTQRSRNRKSVDDKSNGIGD